MTLIDTKWLEENGVHVHHVMPSHDNTMVHSVYITAHGCEALLGLNTNNRTPKRNQNSIVAQQIANGQFVFNGDAIRISKEGLLLDGQNRLLAHQKARSGFNHLIITNLELGTRATMDIGTPRKPSDELKMHGVDHSKLVAAAVVKVITFASDRDMKQTADKMAVQMWGKRIAEEGSIYKSISRYTKGPKGVGDALPIALHFIYTRLGYGEEADAALRTWATFKPSYEDDPMVSAAIRVSKNSDSGINNQKHFFSAWVARMKGQKRKTSTKRDMVIPEWTYEELNAVGDDQ